MNDGCSFVLGPCFPLSRDGESNNSGFQLFDKLIYNVDCLVLILESIANIVGLECLAKLDDESQCGSSWVVLVFDELDRVDS